MADKSAEHDPLEALHEAIKAYLTAAGYGDGLLIDWMVVTAQHMIPEEGGSATALSLLVSHEQPLYKTAGLTQYAVNKTQQRLINNG